MIARSVLIFRVAAVSLVALVWASITARADTVFFDDFNGPSLNPVYQAALPDAPWRFSADSFNATYIGASNFSFQSLTGASVITLQNTLNNAQREGFSTSSNFSATGSILFEARFNTLIQSASTGIDELLEIWILDPTNLNRYDEVGLSTPGFGSQRVFTAMSSISGSGLDTNFGFTNGTWYRLVISGSPTQQVRASFYADDGTTELIGVNLGHTLSSYNSGFKIGFSQSMGLPNQPSPTSVAVDYLQLTVAVPEPASVVILGTGALLLLGWVAFLKRRPAAG